MPLRIELVHDLDQFDATSRNWPRESRLGFDAKYSFYLFTNRRAVPLKTRLSPQAFTLHASNYTANLARFRASFYLLTYSAGQQYYTSNRLWDRARWRNCNKEVERMYCTWQGEVLPVNFPSAPFTL